MEDGWGGTGLVDSFGGTGTTRGIVFSIGFGGSLFGTGDAARLGGMTIGGFLSTGSCFTTIGSCFDATDGLDGGGGLDTEDSTGFEFFVDFRVGKPPANKPPNGCTALLAIDPELSLLPVIVVAVDEESWVVLVFDGSIGLDLSTVLIFFSLVPLCILLKRAWCPFGGSGRLSWAPDGGGGGGGTGAGI